jgi:hypothetical protein
MPQPRTPAKTKKATKVAKAAEAEAAIKKAEKESDSANLRLLNLCIALNPCDMF